MARCATVAPRHCSRRCRADAVDSKTPSRDPTAKERKTLTASFTKKTTSSKWRGPRIPEQEPTGHGISGRWKSGSRSRCRELAKL
eukprot:1560317-Alexandrium_andersonii.AAC.1